MAKKKKKKQKYNEYEEYDEYEEKEDESYYEEEEEEEEDHDDDKEEEEEESSESISVSSARSVGRTKKRKNLKSSFVRAKAHAPQQRQVPYSPSRRQEQQRRGPHFGMAGHSLANRTDFRSKISRKVRTSIFAAWGKLFALVLALAGGTWLAFSLGGTTPFPRNQTKESPVSAPEAAASGNDGEHVVPEIVQRPQNVSQNQTPTRTIRETSTPLDLKHPANAKQLLQDLAAIAPMVQLPGGAFQMGDDHGKRIDQRPAHQVHVAPFQIDVYLVTNRQFQLFIASTDYETTAEKQGWSYVFDKVKKDWVKREKASWKSHQGIDFWGNELLDHPVVHVSWKDATAFCQWCGKKLPTEAQWEYTARGGRVDMVYPWGTQLTPEGKFMANFWQGWFPDQNTEADGFLLTSPVSAFPPNSFGVYDLSGNVWEWCSDWYQEDFYHLSGIDNPQGAQNGQHRVVRGGSFLSAENRDAGYAVATRSFQSPELSYQDLGFRCVTEIFQ